MITQEFNLNLIPSSAPVVVHVDQYDHGTGRLVASLYNGDTPYVPTNPSVYIQGTKPDGKYFISSTGMSIEGNVITADLIKTMTQVAGRTRTQFVVTEPTGRTGTFVFWLDVQETAMPDDSEISDTDISMIENAVETVQEAVIEAAEFAQASSDNKEDSEAWAKGTRNGEDVPSTDETYHNNAKYYAEQAAQSASHGGHTIKNENGTAMTARTNLQFANADVEDDAENDCTVVTPRGGTGGSKIVVTTSEASLHNKNVTISDGTTTVTEQFSAEGVATFTGITMTGMLTITSTDGTETATDTLNVPYYGNYTKAIAFVTFTAILNISTSASSLYGQTITITKGGSTVGTTTFSAQGTVSFAVHEIGEYTCECDGYSASVTVSAETTYNVSINAGLDLASWITAGSVTGHTLNPSSYADFAALEADEAALRQLMLVHDAVDYLATASAGDSLMQSVIGSDICAKWINNSDYALDTLGANTDIADEMDTADKYGYGEWVITDNTTTPVTWGAKGNVPIMTANNAPYGEAVATSASVASHNAYLAFDGNDSTNAYAVSPASTTGRLGYKFPCPVNVKEAYIKAGYGANTVCKLSYSDDGSTWTDDDGSAETFTVGMTELTVKRSQDNGYHIYWSISFNAASAISFGTNTLQFYGRELKPLVPTMTSNTTPKGTVKGVYSNSANAYKVFDGDNTTYASDERTSGGDHVGQIYYEFDEPVICGGFGVLPYYIQSNGNQYLRDYIIKASNDGETWVDVDSGRIAYAATTLQKKGFANNTAYKYWSIYGENGYQGSASGVMTNGGMIIYTLQFYGSDYSEKEFATGSTRKTIYDHGVLLGGALTTDVSVPSNYTSVAPTMASNAIEFRSTSSHSCVIITPLISQATERYTTLNMVLSQGQQAYNNIYGRIDLLTSKTANTSWWVNSIANANVGSNNIISNPTTLDMTNISNDVYIAFAVIDARQCDMSEMWLE